jgi:hypothetical protein
MLKRNTTQQRRYNNYFHNTIPHRDSYPINNEDAKYDSESDDQSDDQKNEYKQQQHEHKKQTAEQRRFYKYYYNTIPRHAPASIQHDHEKDKDHSQSSSSEEQDDYEEPQADYEEPQDDYEEPQADYEEPQDDYEEPQADYEEPQDDYEEPQDNQEHQEETRETVLEQLNHEIHEARNDPEIQEAARMYKRYTNNPKEYKSELHNYHIFKPQDWIIFDKHKEQLEQHNHITINQIFILCDYKIGILLHTSQWNIMEIRMLLHHALHYYEHDKIRQSIIEAGLTVFEDPDYDLQDLEHNPELDRRISRRL